MRKIQNCASVHIEGFELILSFEVKYNMYTKIYRKKVFKNGNVLAIDVLCIKLNVDSIPVFVIIIIFTWWRFFLFIWRLGIACANVVHVSIKVFARRTVFDVRLFENATKFKQIKLYSSFASS